MNLFFNLWDLFFFSGRSKHLRYKKATTRYNENEYTDGCFCVGQDLRSRVLLYISLAFGLPVD